MSEPTPDAKGNRAKEVRRQKRLRMLQKKNEAKEEARAQKALKATQRDDDAARARLERHQQRVARLGEEMGFDADRPVTIIPPLPDGFIELGMTTIEADRTYIRIAQDPVRNEVVYEVIEPTLESTEAEALEFLRDTLIRTMSNRRNEGRTDHGLAKKYLRDALDEAIVDHAVLVDEVAATRIHHRLVRDFLGYGSIDVLMQDPMIEDISCDGPGIPIYLFHREYESIRSTVVFPDEVAMDSFVIRLAQQSGKHISIADPLLDATLPDGSRLQTTLSREVTTRGSTFTIRRFRADPMTPPDLVRYGTISPELGAYLWFVMETGASLLMAGGTASGKTTTLNAACQFIPPEKKVVSIEDTREINLDHENWIAGVTRSGFGGDGHTNSGAVDMYDLLAAALRQRPEYLLVGEVRGPEALTLFQAMATGHAVYSTMHADSVASAVYRLENAPINVPRMMLQTMDCMAIQGQVRVAGQFTRRVLELTEVVGFDPETGDLLTNTVFQWNPATDEHEFLGKSFILERMMEHRSINEREMEAEWKQRVEILERLDAAGVCDLERFASLVQAYYRDPAATTALIRAGKFDGKDGKVTPSHGPQALATTATGPETRRAAPESTPPQDGAEPNSEPTATMTPMDRLTIRQLRDVAADRGVELGNLRLKADIVAALEGANNLDEP